MPDISNMEHRNWNGSSCISQMEKAAIVRQEPRTYGEGRVSLIKNTHLYLQAPTSICGG